MSKIIKPERLEQAPAQGDPFADLSKLRLSQAFTETAGVKKLLTTVPVRKPKKFDFNRVHPGEEYRGDFALIELKDESETYLVMPEIAREIPGEFFMATVYTAINRLGSVFLWPVRLPNPRSRVSLLDCSSTFTMSQATWSRSRATSSPTRWARIGTDAPGQSRSHLKARLPPNPPKPSKRDAERAQKQLARVSLALRRIGRRPSKRRARLTAILLRTVGPNAESAKSASTQCTASRAR
jgi:hypothetical protein